VVIATSPGFIPLLSSVWGHHDRHLRLFCFTRKIEVSALATPTKISVTRYPAALADYINSILIGWLMTVPKAINSPSRSRENPAENWYSRSTIEQSGLSCSIADFTHPAFQAPLS
jgi:hypothetical protein